MYSCDTPPVTNSVYYFHVYFPRLPSFFASPVSLYLSLTPLRSSRTTSSIVNSIWNFLPIQNLNTYIPLRVPQVRPTSSHKLLIIFTFYVNLTSDLVLAFSGTYGPIPLNRNPHHTSPRLYFQYLNSHFETQ